MTNETDVIKSLGQKEEELENLLREAKEKASKIKEDAMLRAEEVKIAQAKKLDVMLEEYKTIEMEKLKNEAEVIKEAAIKKAEGIRLMSEERMEVVIERVMHYIIEGIK